jgi:23S rRNA pseudouridine1911/1915/1917 synthase
MSLVSETLKVEPADAGQRLDRWLTSELRELDYDVSRTQVQQWIADGFVNGTGKLKPGQLIETGEVYHVVVPDPEPLELVGDDVPFGIEYLDDDVVVVNKPRGLVVHPAAGHTRGTLVNGLIFRGVSLAPFGGSLRPGVVHRIDKDTSGLLMLARTERAFQSLSEQLREHTVHRVYRAIVHGQLTHAEGTIDAPIGRDPSNRQRMAVVKGGKEAVTHFRVLERFSHFTYVELKLETGRTHQIRVHMAYIGHPLAGDPVYGPRRTLDIDGQALHAMELGFSHPRTATWMSFRSSLPADMEALLTQLRTDLV